MLSLMMLMLNFTERFAVNTGMTRQNIIDTVSSSNK